MKLIIDIPKSYYNLNDIQNGSIACSQILKAVKNGIPYEERLQGEWELHGMIYYCSNCGHYCGESGDNFCGNCGADMRKGGND